MRADAIFASAGILLSKIGYSLESRHGVKGYARVLAEPAYNGLVGSERLLRQAIPILILTFLAVAALIRFAALADQREMLEADARRDLLIAAHLLVAESGAIEAAGDKIEAIQALLTSGLPAELLEAGRHIVVSDASGKIVQTMPGLEGLIGDDLADTLGIAKKRLTLGYRATIVLGDYQGEDVMTASAKLDDQLGLVTIFQTDDYLTNWKRDVSVNVTLFALTSLILLVILYAYFRQAGRAQDADALYQETHDLVDTALCLGHCGLWDWDLARGSVYLSPSFYEMLGMRPREEALRFRDLEPLLHPQDVNPLRIARSVIAGKASHVDHTFRIRRQHGDYMWLRARAEVTRTRNGETHMVGIAVDVSDQQALAEKTSEAHRQLHSAIENISETFVLCDEADRIVLCNSKYRAIFGLTEGDTREGTHLGAIIRKSRKPIESRSITSPTFQEGERASEILMPDGRWLLLSERRTRNGFISIGADVTQLKLQQSRLHESERRLMAVIRDLTDTKRDAERKAAQLQELNASFKVEKNRAEIASRAKTTFLANMSHELRTPLNAILGFSEILRHGTFGPLGSPKYAEYVDDIHDSGAFLLRLIDDILDMAKIEAGRISLSPQLITLNDVVSEATRIIDIPAGRSNVAIEMASVEDIVLKADKRAIKQVLLNLMSNAVKFSEPGGTVRVDVKARGKAAIISVADRGQGIAREALAKLGRPFEQTECELTRNKKGTGLGLAIARSLIELHGGRMRIASTLGEGTIVTIRLPLEGQAPLTLPVKQETALVA